MFHLNRIDIRFLKMKKWLSALMKSFISEFKISYWVKDSILTFDHWSACLNNRFWCIYNRFFFRLSFCLSRYGMPVGLSYEKWIPETATSRGKTNIFESSSLCLLFFFLFKLCLPSCLQLMRPQSNNITWHIHCWVSIRKSCVYY